jgi:thiamine biosynthesis lipoprotein
MKRISVLLAALFLSAAGCVQQELSPKTVQKTESIMGTEVTVTVVARTAGEGERAIDAAMTEIKRLDAMMSLYKDNSEITGVNLAAGKRPVRVSPEMIEVAAEAEKIARLSNGAFDVTIGPLVVLWQMGLKEGKVPTDEEIKRILPRVGYRNIVIDKKASTLFLKKPDMIMDFGGCAKGYAADKAAEVLRKQGIRNGIVAIAGDIRAMGRREDGKPWRIGVQHPREAGKTLTVLELSDKSISTSGDYERFQIVKKKRYHHILDPRTGRPSHGMESVTIIGDRGAVIDPLTTALFILGPEKGMKIVKDLGCDAIFVDDKGRVAATEGIKIDR